MRVADLFEDIKDLGTLGKTIQRRLERGERFYLDFAWPWSVRKSARAKGWLEHITTNAKGFDTDTMVKLVAIKPDGHVHAAYVDAQWIEDNLDLVKAKRNGVDYWKVVNAKPINEALGGGSMLVRIVKSKIDKWEKGDGIGKPVYLDLHFRYGPQDSRLDAEHKGRLLKVIERDKIPSAVGWAGREPLVMLTYQRDGGVGEKSVIRKASTFDDTHDLIDEGTHWSLRNINYGEHES